jgi:hypothetical protein
MIFKWVYHTDLNARERLMMVMFEMGMATLKDLSIVMGYSEDYIFHLYKQIRYRPTKEAVEQLNYELREIKASTSFTDIQKKEKAKEIKQTIKNLRDEWAVSYRQAVESRGSNNRLYTLGPKGIEYCMTFMHERGSWKIKESQKNHYDGVNKILTRLIQSFGRNRLKWYYSSEATDVLLRIWEMIKQDEWERNPKLARKEKREMIRPDGLCLIDNTPYWIEFDNDTEKSKQLVEKMRSYRNAIAVEEAESINYPVIWVTTNPHRRDELNNIWEIVKEEYYSGERVPEMYFFVKEEETEWFEKRHKYQT